MLELALFTARSVAYMNGVARSAIPERFWPEAI